MKEEENRKSQKIEIVKGKPKDIKISDVRDNLSFEVSENTTKKKGEIIIPKNHKKDN